jgi:DHA3 family macrolide efflux protein-like MFS transporter
VDVATAAVAIIIMFFIRIPAHSKASEVQVTSVIEDLKQGVLFVKGNRLIRNLLIYYAFFFFLISPAAFLTPLLITRSYGVEVWRLTANEILYGGGAIIGGFVMAIWGGFKNRMLTIALSCAAYGISAVLLGVASNFFFYLTVMFFTGIFSPIFNAAETVLIQESVDNDMQGRVFSIIDIIILAVMPIGMLIFGPIADLIKVEYIMIATGIFMVVVGWVINTNNKNRSNKHSS